MLFGIAACTDNSSQTPVQYPDPESIGARMLITRCSFCHMAPHPGTHAAAEWPGVLQRMQVRMQSKGFPPLSNDDLEIVQNYLQQHAHSATEKLQN